MGENKGSRKEKNGGGGRGAEKKDKGPTEVVLDMFCVCEDLVPKIKKYAKRFEGVESVTLDQADNKLTVTGTADPWMLQAFLKDKTGKMLEIVSPANQPKKAATADNGKKATSPCKKATAAAAAAVAAAAAAVAAAAAAVAAAAAKAAATAANGAAAAANAVAAAANAIAATANAIAATSNAVAAAVNAAAAAAGNSKDKKKPVDKKSKELIQTAKVKWHSQDKDACPIPVLPLNGLSINKVLPLHVLFNENNTINVYVHGCFLE